MPGINKTVLIAWSSSDGPPEITLTDSKTFTTPQKALAYLQRDLLPRLFWLFLPIEIGLEPPMGTMQMLATAEQDVPECKEDVEYMRNLLSLAKTSTKETDNEQAFVAIQSIARKFNKKWNWDGYPCSKISVKRIKSDDAHGLKNK